MKLRNKLSIILLVAFVLNITILLSYYKLFLSPKISSDFNLIQIELDETLDNISSLIIEGKDKDYIKNIVENNELIHEIYVEDSKGNVLYNKDVKDDSRLALTSVDMINIEGETYMIKISNTKQITSLKESSALFLNDILIFKIFDMSAILMLVAFVIYHEIVRPILYLQRDIENYKHGIKPNRVERKDEIGWIKDNFINLTEKLEAEKENQNRIIASISHDIKTPLTSIMGYAERIKNKEMSEERRKKYIEIIYLKSQDMKGLIDEFDDYVSFKMESGIKKEKTTIKELVKTLQEEYEDELNQLDIKLVIECNYDEKTLNIDKLKIRRVFGNIIGNAVKHMKNIDKEIKISFNTIDDNVLICISDNGNGVDNSEIEMIFEALYTSDKSRKVAGLGLSICKSVIQAHGGNIWAENNQSGGLTIKFSLPNEKYLPDEHIVI